MTRIPTCKFEDLTPRSDSTIDKGNHYMNTIQCALKKENVTNIAITGVYGSGKSSIIEKFKHSNSKYNFLTVSLAAFTLSEETLNNKSSYEEAPNHKEISSNIERGVLQQLFYQVSTEEIPYSRFKKINNITQAQITIYFSIFLLTIIAGIFFFRPDVFSLIERQLNLMTNNGLSPMLSLILFLIFILGIAYFLYLSTLSLVRKAKLSKFTIEKVGIEFDATSKQSVFNEYLDEIIYFFEATPYDVIIFEDLDRFDKIDIFIKLRELNTIINNNKKIKQEKKVVFIYAIKDEMFKGKERTKFFDFIIPVIPVIGSSNSFEKMLNKVRDAGLNEEQISDEFLMDITVFIDDMRVLTNIFNEFALYLNKLDLAQNYEKMLAIIVYKNLCPDDFALLQMDEGLVYEAFENNEKIRKELIDDLNYKLQELNNKLEATSQEILSDNKELNAVFIANIILKYQKNIRSIHFNKQNLSQEQFLNRDINYKDLPNNTNIELVNNYGHTQNIVLGNISDFDINEYVERQIIINEKQDVQQEKIKQEIGRLKKRLRVIEYAKFYQLNENYSFEFTEEYSKKERKIIPFLLRRGYLDETYPNYISYFHKGSLTYEDMNYVLNVKDQVSLGYYYELTNIEHVIKKLHLRDFQHKAFFNVNIVDELVKNDTFNEKLNKCLELLCDGSKESKEFLTALWKNGIEKIDIIKNVSRVWPGLWAWVVEESSFDEDDVKELFVCIMEVVNVKNILQFEQPELFRQDIQSRRDFLFLVKEVPQIKIEQIISEFEIKFLELDIDMKKNSLVDFIFTNCYFEINIPMITAALEIYSKCTKDQIKTQNYTSIQESEISWLQQYVLENLQDYIVNVLLQLKENGQESKHLIIALLEKEEIDLDLKERILTKQNIVFEDISTLPEDIWEIALKHNKATGDWSNILAYYDTCSYDKPVSDFIKAHLNSLIEHRIPREDVDFQTSLILDNSFTLEQFSDLLSTFSIIIPNIDLANVSSERIVLLIEANMLLLSNEYYENLKSSNRDLHIKLIEKQPETFVENLAEYVVETEDLESIIESPNINKEHKKEIINQCAEPLLEGAPNLINKVADFFASNYPEEQIASDQILVRLLGSGIPQEKKAVLLTNQMRFVDEPDLEKLLDIAGKPFSDLTVRPQPKLPNREVNKNLLEELKKLGIVSSYKEEDEILRAYLKQNRRI
ncbi:YobI family P-loop NTPase [Dethiobacter alkaliphilus]|uniref:YobI family P-loop NTPase n=1 Tax=Dethiobacter alkaliphilus TaxID=427926 RepID=UPI0022279409|nr:hypothetical protein [Dethiobacter alkaliphilus]MCW3491332.1 hypothetical protein [Dethiobacter alkaliphilus]